MKYPSNGLRRLNLILLLWLVPLPREFFWMLVGVAIDVWTAVFLIGGFR